MLVKKIIRASAEDLETNLDIKIAVPSSSYCFNLNVTEFILPASMLPFVFVVRNFSNSTETLLLAFILLLGDRSGAIASPFSVSLISRVQQSEEVF